MAPMRPPSCVFPTCSTAAGHGYALLLECAQLLLTLGSSALYSPSARGQLGQHPYLDALMQQRDLANRSECFCCAWPPCCWFLPGASM